jgi:Tfp pilus assembly protein PilO
VKDARRIWLRRAGLLATAGVLLAGNLGFFLWYRGTARDRKVALEERRAALERDVQARETEARKLAADRDRLSEVRAAIDRFYGHSVGRRDEALAGIVDELHVILKRFGVSPGEIGYAISPVKNPPVSQMLISFGFRGDYNKFKQLLEGIQTGRKWIAVREIGLARDQDVPGSVQVRLSLVTYFASDETETARASLAKGSAR